VRVRVREQLHSLKRFFRSSRYLFFSSVANERAMRG
jgi:hypothetical protein